MNGRVVVIFACATVFATCLSYAAYQTLGRRGRATPQIHLAGVVVAARDLEVGTLIGPNDVKTVQWVGGIPKGIATKTDMAVNRGVVSKIYEGEPIMSTRLATVGAGGGLAATIPAGMRACAVKVNEVVGVAGFVIPGTRVDVLISGIPPGAAPDSGPRVTTLLQNIQVLSAGTNIQKDNEGKPQQVQVVNLLVSPTEAESLSLAGSEAHIQLILRNPMDTEIAKTPGTAMASLFGPAAPGPRAPTVVKPAPRGGITAPPAEPQRPPALIARTVEVMNGLTRTEVRFARVEDRP